MRWAVHEGLRHLLFHYVREEARHRWRDQWKDPAKLAGAGALLSPNVLTLGFARVRRSDASLVIAGNDLGAGRTIRRLVQRRGLQARTLFTGLLRDRERLQTQIWLSVR